MTDHHDFGDHDFDDGPLPFEDPHAELPVPEPWEHEFDAPDDGLPEEVHAAAVSHDVLEETDISEILEVLPADEIVDVFPPAVDVGELPEPVDGFPWVDSGSLGLADIAAALHDSPTAPVQPAELAEYAATDLPAGADPWAALADSDDPATSTLARWWSTQN